MQKLVLAACVVLVAFAAFPCSVFAAETVPSSESESAVEDTSQDNSESSSDGASVSDPEEALAPDGLETDSASGETVVVQEERPIWSTPFEDYTVTEAYLMVICILLLLAIGLNFFVRGIF